MAGSTSKKGFKIHKSQKSQANKIVNIKLNEIKIEQVNKYKSLSIILKTTRLFHTRNKRIIGR